MGKFQILRCIKSLFKEKIMEKIYNLQKHKIPIAIKKQVTLI
jgi:hypothetical protein